MTSTESERVQARAEAMSGRASQLREQLGRVVVGQTELIEDLTVALFAGGHILLEGLPGLGKTSLVRALAESLGIEFARIQFTPDLMPADITGTRVVEERNGQLEFRFHQGPLFANLVLADEINRTTPKTQSALLEAMQEGSVTVGNETYQLPRPFAVVATQNPIELEGTYPLPEAQLDRFLYHLIVPSPGAEDLQRILAATTGNETEQLQPLLKGEEVLEVQALARDVLCGEHLLRYVAQLVYSTDPRLPDASEETRRMVRYGASPRAGQAIVLSAKVRALLDGRPSVSLEDIRRSTLPALRHRVVLSFEAEANGWTVEKLLPGWDKAAEKTRS